MKCLCGWRRPLIVAVMADGTPAPDGLLLAYFCPCCGHGHGATEVTIAEAVEVMQRQRREDEGGKQGR